MVTIDRVETFFVAPRWLPVLEAGGSLDGLVEPDLAARGRRFRRMVTASASDARDVA
jgi:hypothetical protein